MGDKTDELRDKLDDTESVGGTVDDDSGAVLTLDTGSDEQPSSADNDSDSTADESSDE